MDYRERWEDREEALLAALDAFSARTWCSGPGIVDSVSLETQTCSIQPAIMGRVQAQDGSYSWVKLPLLVDCPIIFLRGGGFTITAPLKKGDEVVVFFADRCIDGWWSSGQVSPQSEIRFHDLSDGFVMPGPSSKPKVVPNISTDSLEIRSEDGSQYIRISPNGVMTIVAPGGITINNVLIAPDGTVTSPKEIFAFNDHSVSQHTHTQLNDSGGNVEVAVNTPTG